MELAWNQGIFKWLGMFLLVAGWLTGFQCWSIAAENQPVDAAGKGNELFYLARRMFYNGEAGIEKIHESLSAAQDVYGLRYHGIAYTMSHYQQAMKLLNQAISLEPQNYAAYNSLATYYLNAPAIGGGSVDRGITALRKALASKDEHDNFLSYYWLGIAYTKQKKRTEAIRSFERALTIYPNHSGAKVLLKKAESISK